MPDKFNKLLIDANVIIDYQNANMTPLILLNRYVGKVHVLPEIVREVRGLAIADCERYGFVIVEATPEQKITAEIEKSIVNASMLTVKSHAACAVSEPTLLSLRCGLIPWRCL